jgi:hypothetical protein
VIDSLIFALKWRFDPDAAGRLEASCELRLADDRFRVEVGDGQIEVQRAEADERGDRPRPARRRAGSFDPCSHGTDSEYAGETESHRS